MTTVAWDGHMLAVDSKVSSNGTMCGITNKLIQLNDTDWLACAGIREYAIAVARWLREGRDAARRPKFSTKERFGAFWWHVADRSVLAIDGAWANLGTGMYQWSDELLEPIPLSACDAIGTGAELAIGAMLAGADARRAVELACDRDNASGLPVQWIELQ